MLWAVPHHMCHIMNFLSAETATPMEDTRHLPCSVATAQLKMAEPAKLSHFELS